MISGLWACHPGRRNTPIGAPISLTTPTSKNGAMFMLADAVKVTGFHLPSVAPAANAVVVAKEPSVPTDPRVAAALGQRSTELLRGIENHIIATRSSKSELRNSLETATWGHSVLALGVGALTGSGAFMVASGIAAAGFIGANRLLKCFDDFKINRKLSDVAIIEKIAGQATGIERAWLLRRAAMVAEVAGNCGVGKRLAALASSSVLTVSEQADIASIEAIHSSLFPLIAPEKRDISMRAFSSHPLLVDYAIAAPVRVTFADQLETFMSAIEKMTPEGRALLRNIVVSDAVLQLSADSGNHWRVRRFVDVLDGTRTPYADAASVESGALSSTVEQLRELRGKGGDSTVHDEAHAIDILPRRIINDTTRAQVVVDSGKTAERVAAYFETQGLRAALYEKAADAILVSIYDPEVPLPAGYATRLPGSSTAVAVA